MGLVNYIFELSHVRILELFILLPAYFALQRQRDNVSFGRYSPDKALAAYLLLAVILSLLATTLTDAMRYTFYLFIDVFLPYYVVSRSLKNLRSFRDALLSFVLAVMVVGLLAAFESYKHWLLYGSLIEVLKLDGTAGYLGRDGLLRAVVTAGQSIPLGYVMAVAIGFYLYLKESIQQKFIRRAGMLLLVAGLVVPFSRGPWVGAAVLIIAFVATGQNAVRKSMSLAIVAMLALALTSILPGGERVINLLPFIGSTEKGNIDYRQQLLTNSMIVIQRNPWFGSNDYLKTPEMEAMRQGQGIIDIVNTYIAVTLQSGYVGLSLFIGFFVLSLLGIYRRMRSISDKTSEEHLLGQSLFATLLAILVIIFTVSSITIIPIVYWSVAGLGVAYAQMIRRQPGRKILQ
jgi:O-antigen ligase